MARKRIFGAVAVMVSGALALSGCMGGNTGGSQEGTMTVWWAQGITKEEDAAARAIIEAWGEENDVPVKITFITGTDMPAKLSTAVTAGNAPDIAFSPDADQKLNPGWAAEGLLEDVTDVIKAREGDLLDIGQNAPPRGENGEYYAVPLEIMPFYPYYRTDFTAEAGLADAPPTDWDGFWKYFMDAQDGMRAAGVDDVYGLGLPASTESLDGTGNIMWLFNAMGVDFLDDNGNALNTPENAAAIEEAFQWTKDLSDKGYIPPSAVSWGSPDNNTELERGGLVMTPNPTLSIATGSKVANPEFHDALALAAWPSGPNGDPVVLPLQVKSLVVFKSSLNPELAKDLAGYIVEADNLQSYMEAANGLFAPVYESQYENPYWEADRFRAVVKESILAGNISVWPYSENPKFAAVFNENLMQRGMGSVLLGESTPAEAATALLDRIEELLK